MTVEGDGVEAELRKLVAEDGLSMSALHAMTGIEPERLATLLVDSSSSRPAVGLGCQVLSPDEIARVSVLEAMLVRGLDIDDDERLRGIMESLTMECGLTARNLARLTGVDVDVVGAALKDPGVLPDWTKYVLALRASYILNAANHARAR